MLKAPETLIVYCMQHVSTSSPRQLFKTFKHWFEQSHWPNPFSLHQHYEVINVATLTLCSQPRQRVCKSAGQEGSLGVTFHAPKSAKSVREWTFTLPKELPLWELESQWTPKSSKSDCRGQNPMDWRITYIIGKLLEPTCLKWACMTHLDTWNTSYGQKKGWKSN